MSCSSAIYTVNSSNPALSENSDIPVGSTVRRFGPAIKQDGNSIVLRGSGYYDCDCSVSVTPTAADPITVQLYQDGNAVPGALATVTPVAGSTVNLKIDALVRICGCDCSSVLNVRTDAAGTLVNMALVVEKI